MQIQVKIKCLKKIKDCCDLIKLTFDTNVPLNEEVIREHFHSSSSTVTVKNVQTLHSVDYWTRRHSLPAVADTQSCSARRRTRMDLSSAGSFYDLHGQTSRAPLCKLQQALLFPAAGAHARAEHILLRGTHTHTDTQFKPGEALLQRSLHFRKLTDHE